MLSRQTCEEFKILAGAGEVIQPEQEGRLQRYVDTRAPVATVSSYRERITIFCSHCFHRGTKDDAVKMESQFQNTFKKICDHCITSGTKIFYNI